MKFKCIVEYEYPVSHKPPVKAELVLHGDRVVTDNIEPYNQKQGKWCRKMSWECSCCHKVEYTQDIASYHYCRHCGAKMGEVTDDTKR